MAFDPSGNLYVASGSTVIEFAPGSTTPGATLTGLSYPVALAFDQAGDLYVANNIDGTVHSHSRRREMLCGFRRDEVKGDMWDEKLGKVTVIEDGCVTERKVG